MNRIFILSLIAMSFLTAGLSSADWKGKEFTLWSAKDVDEILSDSPWSKGLTVALGLPRGTGDDATPEVGGGGGRRGGRGAGVVFDPAAPTMDLVVSWRTALPMKEALVKRRMGETLQIPEDMQSFLTQSEERYVIAVSGIQARFARALQGTGSLDGTTIRRGKKEPILPVGLNLQQGENNTVEALYFFPRTVPITLEDKEIEVVIKIGQFEVKKKFSLKDMLFNGKLEL